MKSAARAAAPPTAGPVAAGPLPRVFAFERLEIDRRDGLPARLKRAVGRLVGDDRQDEEVGGPRERDVEHTAALGIEGQLLVGKTPLIAGRLELHGGARPVEIGRRTLERAVDPPADPVDQGDTTRASGGEHGRSEHDDGKLETLGLVNGHEPHELAGLTDRRLGGVGGAESRAVLATKA